MEQLQADLGTLEQDYARLKASAANAPERPGTYPHSYQKSFTLIILRRSLAQGAQPTEGPEIVAVEGSLETSHLLELASSPSHLCTSRY